MFAVSNRTIYTVTTQTARHGQCESTVHLAVHLLTDTRFNILSPQYSAVNYWICNKLIIEDLQPHLKYVATLPV